MARYSFLLLLACISATINSVSAVDAFVTVFSDAETDTDGCADNGEPLLSESVTVGSCDPYITAMGTIYAIVSDCSTVDGAWVTKIYADSSCTSTALATLSGSDACDCDSATISGSTFNMRVSCQSTANDCVGFAVYVDSGCASKNLVSYDLMMNGDCYYESTYGVSARIACNGGFSDDSWTSQLYLSNSCSGVAIASDGSDACSCDKIDAPQGTASIQVNCGGFWPSCNGGAGSCTAASTALGLAGAVAGVAAVGLGL